MGREHDSRAGDKPCFLERHLARGTQLADALDGAEEAVAFVQVEDARVDAQGAQRANPADAEHDLLAQPAVGFRHVEAVGDVAEVLRVCLEVGVEQKERNPANLCAPNGDAHVARAHRRLDLHSFDFAHGQVGAAVLGVHLELPPARIDVLPAEALLVEKTNGDQRQAQVARGLQVVARQDPEPAGVDRQALGEPKLEREVRDGHRRLRVHEAGVAVVVVVVDGASSVECLTHLVALTRPLDAILAKLAQQEHRILARRLPELGVQGAEKSFDARLPGPQ